MVTDQQVRRMFKLAQTQSNVGIAAAKGEWTAKMVKRPHRCPQTYYRPAALVHMDYQRGKKKDKYYWYRIYVFHSALGFMYAHIE